MAGQQTGTADGLKGRRAEGQVGRTGQSTGPGEAHTSQQVYPLEVGGELQQDGPARVGCEGAACGSEDRSHIKT